MEPHSRLSQFNVRQPKAGPVASNLRFMESQQKSTDPVENFKKRPDAPSRRSFSSSTSLYASRPIATNSRVKQDEQYRQRGYLVFVNNALQQKNNGNSDAFDELVDQFNPKKSTADASLPLPQLRDWILALSHAVSRLERCHSALVEAIVNMPWTVMDTSFVKSYTAFIGMLVSARPEYLSLVLGKIAHGFTYQSGLQALDSRLPSTSTSPLTRRVVYDRIHYLLLHIYSLIPTLPSTLHPLLVRSFPHKRQSQAAQITYIRNILRVTQYCPELAEAVLGTIVDRAIQIDVEIQVELEELEERLSDEDQHGVFELDPFDIVVGQEGEESDEDDDEDVEGDNLSDLSSDAGGEVDDESKQVDDVPTDFKHVQGMVDKLDAILKNLFDHFNHIHAETPAVHLSTPGTPSSRSDSPSTPLVSVRPPSPSSFEEGRLLRRQQFHTLLSIFDRTILRTFKSRYTQFLVFWYSSLDPEFSDLFQGMLVSKSLLEEDQPAVTRAAAASYIASFVSRAQFVDRESTRRVVACLCNFLRSRLDIFDAINTAGAPPPSVAHYSVFYAVAQAVFLIFCFRWRDLLEDEEDVDEFTVPTGPAKKWMAELHILQRVVQSDLNPLKVCSPNVVMQFARVAHATDFIYCYTIMESNRRSEYAPTTPVSNGVQTSKRSAIHPSMLGRSMTTELNTFFPFDPYKLPRSGSYIQGVYREWSSVAIDDEEDEDEEDGDIDEGDGEPSEGHRPDGIFMAGGKATTEEDEADGLGESLGGMSISPYRPGSVAMNVSVS
ncbi:RNA polymerase I-specific transcription initiation factor RRN3 [Daedalea quercina L-15889]|uniref:RNA polymerase I-specific transcription initiation factor RRN3 n=1 Tax=Daedalea quercina L-15889 TaxID=1314783 RepID=A0A165S357_9APHY|nr:RNA polymerase I-specific transcription initiation factor RRN3 [Daedalea quercina L-15889]